MRSRLAALGLLILLAGCTGPHASPSAPTPSPQAASSWLHTVNGGTVSPAADLPLPTFSLRTAPDTWGWEPTLGITESGALFVPTEDQSDLPGGVTSHMGVRRSTDEGLTWDAVTPQVLMRDYPPTFSLDPYVHVDAATDRLYVDELRVDCTTLAWSDDEGTTWQGNPEACGNPIEDHQTLWTGPGADGRALHICSNDAVNTFCKTSTTGGTLFVDGEPPFLDATTPAGCGGLTGHGLTSPSGTRFIGRLHCGEVRIARSTDLLTTWTSAAVPGGNASAGDHDVELAVDSSGTLYAVWLDVDGQPALSSSRDDGQTWSSPVRLGFPGLALAKDLSVAAGKDGRLAWSYLGAMDGGARVHDWHAYVGITLDPWADQGAGVRVATADASGRALVRGATPGGAMNGGTGDFLDIDLLPDGRVVASVVDVCQDACHDPSSAGGLGRGLVGVVVQTSGPHPSPRVAA